MDIPGLALYLPWTSSNWKFSTEPSTNGSFCNALKDKRCPWPRGKGVGGTSTINFMLVTRGTPSDYDEWASLGNEGWSYKDVFPYFLEIENFQVKGDYVNESYHSTDGPVTVAYPSSHSKISELIIEASKELGLEEIDYNGAKHVRNVTNVVHVH